MSLRKLKLAARSALCFGFFCILIVLLGIFAIQQASILNSAEKKIETNIIPSFKVLGVLDREFVSVRNSNSKLRNAGEDDSVRAGDKKDLIRSQLLIQQSMDSLSHLIVTPEGLAAINSLAESFEKFNNIQVKYMALIDAKNFSEAINFTNSEVRNVSRIVAGNIEALKKVNDMKAEAAGDEAEEAYNRMIVLASSFIIVSLIATITLAWFYTKSITTPLLKSLMIAERIATNDFSHDIYPDGTDEMGRLLDALSKMQGNLRSAIIQIGDSSTQLAATAEEMHAVTEDASQGLIRQNNEIEMAATAVNEMSSAVDEVASNAAEASSAASSTAETAIAGRGKVNETVVAINIMVDNVESTSVNVRGLAEMATDISGVLDVIRSVAQQTNLLALNAAIEAARAGEAGRGFAVVADEVRALAHRTQLSTSEIEKMILTIQTSSTDAVTSMNQTSHQAGKTLALAQSAGLALAEITESIEHINDRNVQIATASEEQSQVARQVDANLVSIRDLSIQSAAGSRQTSVASAELSSLAVELSRLVAKFKV
ncbi:methyl-accepting chemotaxis protein [Pseudomonas sp. S35]|uniref:methyl-accepting chemotaxis protein n=2 Tax=Pseudomonas TaxID=286 RepID=UPI00132EAC30|nr:methyl-accepting chemotaxis protein [Pseudomonas sp. S35]QHF44128.1 methyl-accepting chemotaxis protein [Pseudomonas sp. S35]